MLQCTSVSDASWKTIALVAPGEPGERGRQHEGGELVALRAVAERDRARLVVADRLQHLPEGRVDDAVDEEEARGEDREHVEVHRAVVVQVDHAESLPRGTDWMPSSPPVNGACRQKKKTICASASVIIAK
jgi:hypothetical protein